VGIAFLGYSFAMFLGFGPSDITSRYQKALEYLGFWSFIVMVLAAILVPFAFPRKKK